MTKTQTIYLILSTIIIVAICIFFYFSRRQSQVPAQTGGDVMQVVPMEYREESDAMTALNQELPLTTANFTITFSYKKGKYIVTPRSGVNGPATFEKWYSSSSYQAIPKTRFFVE